MSILAIPARTQLVTVSSEILSSYGARGATGGPRMGLRPLAGTTRGVMVPEAATALKALHDAVLARGGDFRVTDCFRTVEEQAAARRRYDNWLAAGKPAPSSKTFSQQTMKADYVAMPAKSGHNAGRAIDIHVDALQFPNVAADRQLDVFWEIAIPIGWRPIVKTPTEGASESWHFDFLGELRPILDKYGYETWAMCAVLDIGAGGDVLPRALERAVQFHLTRRGADLGEIDGVIGPRTERALRERLGVADWKSFSVEKDFARLLG